MGRFARGNQHCLGIEFLPPLAEDTTIAVTPQPRAEAVPVLRSSDGRPPPAPRLFVASRDEPHLWTMDRDDLAQRRDPMANLTLQFLDDLMGEDRRRVRREFGLPVLTMQAFDPQSPGLDLRSDELRAEEEAQWMAENGTRLLRRPFQLLLRRLPLVQSVDAGIADFKSDNVPLTDEYTRAHGRSSLGRFSVRVHPTDLSDPLEVTYVWQGIRIGGSQDHFKVSVTRELLPGFTVSVRALQEFESQAWTVRGDLSWELSERSRIQLAAGRDLDFQSNSTAYSWYSSPLDGSFGVLLYATHIF